MSDQTARAEEGAIQKEALLTASDWLNAYGLAGFSRRDGAYPKVTTLAREFESFGRHVASAAEARAASAEAEVVRLAAENDFLRASLANGSGPCPYCELPQEEWAKCASGFPGCGRADDAMMCPNVGASLEAEASASALADRVAVLEGVLQSILKPFPTVIGPAEDMIEDWMGAVSRFRAIARTALKESTHV